MFQKPNSKSFKGAAVKTVGVVVGAKVSDGVAALMPESTNSYKSIGLAVVGLALAACVNPSTTSGELVQNAFLGMAGKQGYNALTEVLTPAVEVQDGSTATGKFMNALIGHKELPIKKEAAEAAEAAEKMAAAIMWNNDAPVETLESAWERNNQPQEAQIRMAVA